MSPRFRQRQGRRVNRKAGKKASPAGKKRPRRQQGAFEYAALAALAMALLAFGVVMVFSASWGSSFLGQHDSYYYLKRELIFAVMGLVLMFFMARFDYTRLRRLAPALMVASLVLLALVLLPGIGHKTNGARRWIGLGLAGFQPQPAELAKLAVILYMASIMQLRRSRFTSLRTLLPLLSMPALACGLVLIEPDMGTAITIAITLGAMLIVGGVQLRLLAMPAMAGGVGAALSVLVSPHQAARITTFLDPWKDAQGAGYQVIQSWVALASGGLFGVGIGNSVQKFNWLPENHTDMILAIIGEELGLVGVLAVLAGFLLFAFVGYRVALKSRDPFAKYVAAGITTLMISQAAVNFGAVTGLMPLTGVPLPIISYGGSNLVVIMASIGILLNIAINPRSRVAAPGTRKFRAIEGGNRSRRYGGASGPGAGSRRRAHA
ncbi:MAG: putative lipid II flippase FtsW [Actinobacteria bacterium]|nr:putative lipid II flippase FtsW [Actinomycetota bacterium]